MVRHVANVRVTHRITDHLDVSQSRAVVRGARTDTDRLLVRASDQDVQCTHIALPESELRIIDSADVERTPIHSGSIVSNVKTVCEDGSLGQVRCTSLLIVLQGACQRLWQRAFRYQMCMHVDVLCVYEGERERERESVCVCMYHVYMYTCIHTCMCMHVSGALSLSRSLSLSLSFSLSLSLSLCVCVFCVCVCMCVCVCVCV